MSNYADRWNWIVQTFQKLDGPLRDLVIGGFQSRKDDPTRDDIKLYEVMTNLGIIIKGTDPDPPKKTYITDAGAEEYEEIMIMEMYGKDQ